MAYTYRKTNTDTGNIGQHLHQVINCKNNDLFTTLRVTSLPEFLVLPHIEHECMLSAYVQSIVRVLQNAVYPLLRKSNKLYDIKLEGALSLVCVLL